MLMPFNYLSLFITCKTLLPCPNRSMGRNWGESKMINTKTIQTFLIYGNKLDLLKKRMILDLDSYLFVSHIR